jgi:hypothetical protein
MRWIASWKRRGVASSLNELLHGGVLEQGRKAKAQAGELFYLPVALTAFTRFGYLMRRVFLSPDAGRSEWHSRRTDGTGRERDRDHRLPPRPVFRARADHPPAHDLPVVESDVSGGVFVGVSPCACWWTCGPRWRTPWAAANLLRPRRSRNLGPRLRQLLLASSPKLPPNQKLRLPRWRLEWRLR